jgi:hypothetical protein
VDRRPRQPSQDGGLFPPEPTRTKLATLNNMVRHSNEMYGYKGLSASPQKQPNDKYDQQQAADPASDRRSAVVIASAAAKKKQQNQDDQDEVHRFSSFNGLLLFAFFMSRGYHLYASPIERATLGSRAMAIQNRSMVSTTASKASAVSGFVIYPFAWLS